MKRLIHEIHRRSLWQVLGIYLVAGWGALQAVETLTNRLALPDWFPALAIVLLIVGLPIVLATAFVQEGVGRGSPSDVADNAAHAVRGPEDAAPQVAARGGASRQIFTWRRAILGGVAAFALWGVIAAIYVVTGRGGRVQAADDTGLVLAVLPFENLGNPADAYFADGMADEVRSRLAAVGGLSVIARGSAEQYRDSEKSPTQIAHELGATHLLTARVRWDRAAAGTSRVRVTPELVEMRADGTPTVKWQDDFDAVLEDVFRVQADIATQVAEGLDLALNARQTPRVNERTTSSLEAYDAFLRGRDIVEGSGDPPTLRRGIAYFEQAVALDTAFVEAWSALSRALSILYNNSTPSSETRARALAAAERARALAPDRAEAHAALAHYYSRIAIDPARAVEEASRGLRQAPQDVELLHVAALAEQTLGRWEDALAHLDQAARLDPRSVNAARRRQFTLLALRRYPEALEQSNRARVIAPTNLTVLANAMMVHLAMGDLSSARALLRSAAPGFETPALVAYFGNFWDLYWVLDDAQQQLLLRLPPAAFDDDRALWGLVRAQLHALRGATAVVRTYADSARVAFEEQLRDAPEDAQRYVLHGLALAYLGRKQEAVAAGEHALTLRPISRDAYTGPYIQHQLVRIYMLVGEPEKALDKLEPLLRIPYYLSPGWLRVDPTFDPLRKEPRFQRLVASGG